MTTKEAIQDLADVRLLLGVFIKPLRSLFRKDIAERLDGQMLALDHAIGIMREKEEPKPGGQS
jgi:hypothetical protein